MSKQPLLIYLLTGCKDNNFLGGSCAFLFLSFFWEGGGGGAGGEGPSLSKPLDKTL